MKTITILSQVEGLTEAQRAVRDRFQEGGSLATTLLVMLGLAAIVLLVYLLTLRQQHASAPVAPPDPRRLFNDLVRKLHLTPSQRRLLDAVATMQGLKHPAVILLSPALFDRFTGEWRERTGDGTADGNERLQSDLVAETRAVLFPHA